jgi:DNA-binding SARP family transcriptional activator
MSTLRVFLFGKFRVQSGEQTLAHLSAHRAQELFCYLLLHRDRPHPRETLAGLLWGESSTAQSKKYLRKALWQLQTTLDAHTDSPAARVLLVDSDWVEINPQADLWLDVAVFEQAFSSVQGVPGKELDRQRAQSLQSAIDLYRGDLLEGWYQDWCLYERERLQNLYLAMLDKLMGHFEAHQDYEAGLACGSLILRYDRARERTHRQLMRLYYLANDRTAALRQYERCVAYLDEELGVKPAKRTVALYEQIRADKLEGPDSAPPAEAHAEPRMATPILIEALDQLKQVQLILADTHHQVQQNIQAMELFLNHQP